MSKNENDEGNKMCTARLGALRRRNGIFECWLTIARRCEREWQTGGLRSAGMGVFSIFKISNLMLFYSRVLTREYFTTCARCDWRGFILVASCV